MHKLSFFLTTMVLTAITAQGAVNIPLTMASYDVYYHWGFINKLAGHGYASYQASDNRFSAELKGHSIPWGGRIYTASTSLNCNFIPDESGISEEFVSAMQGRYSKPFVGHNPCLAKFKTIYGGGTLDASPQTMEAIEIMADMLSIFYYARELDFKALTPGQELEIPIKRNGVSQTLYLTYKGLSDFSYNGYSTRAYNIEFRYTYNGHPDKYPVNCLIDSLTLIPVEFSASILIGDIQMKYVQ